MDITKLRFLTIALLGLFVFSSFQIQPKADKEEVTKPNIVLILADDLGLMDFGAYGGEATSTHVDGLAARGTMFTNFHASPMCAPSRAMLMTGFDSHRTGVPNLPLFLPPSFADSVGYEGILNNEVKTVATLLKQAGYRTYMTGKWHLGHTEETLPSKRGFDRTFILGASGADNWERKAYLPTQSDPPWFADGVPTELPDDFYSSEHLVDEMIGFMDDDKDDSKLNSQPFFAYLAFQAIHIPVQAPREFIEKYEGVYDGGWDELKQRRFVKAKELGLIPQDAVLGDMLPVLQKWESLSDELKAFKSKSMAVNAAMIEAMDFHIGRYMAYLNAQGKLENTVFIITSDNGPEASDPSLIAGMDLWIKYAGYNRNIETLGEKRSFSFIGPEWASAASGPSAFFKFYAGEGGLRVPMIISGPNIPSGQKESALTMITDITPTILDIAGVSHSEDMDGRSLIPLLTDEQERVYPIDEPIGMEAANQRALFKGDYKLSRVGKPYGDDVWKLFNLAMDPGETKDLAELQPDLYQEMLQDYKDYEIKYGVIEMPKDYEALKEVTQKLIRKIKKPAIAIGISLVALLVYVRRRRRKRKLVSS